MVADAVFVVGAALGIVAVAGAHAWLLHGEAGGLQSLLGGFRADPWPRGVQEDDDVHWSWQRSAAPSEEVAAVPDVLDVREVGHPITGVEAVRGSTHVARH